ncbi:MAG: DUF3410 domain-containing protein [Ignavibacteriaceae bacterium]|nr:DUF3410 domain-containing protein [Ignavibacteriaceae bacterium]
MKIIADENIDFLSETFAKHGELIRMNGRNIPEFLTPGIDALIVRSVTKINSLPEKSNLKFVGTTTIGTDHINIDLLHKNGIYFSNAAGCNSTAVAEWTIAAILNYICTNSLELNKIKLGIVGFGNIGKKVNLLAGKLGIQTFVNDPPLQDEGFNFPFVTLENLEECDIITFHLPLTKSGKYPSYGLIDENHTVLNSNVKLLINSSRGEIISIKTLKKFAESGEKSVYLDVWEGEPVIDTYFLDYVELATPHIAGYTAEGKFNGTMMIYEQFCNFFGFPQSDKLELPKMMVRFTRKDVPALENVSSLLSTIAHHKEDTEQLKKAKSLLQDDLGKYFDELRKNYLPRREWSNIILKSSDFNNNEIVILQTLGFNFED